MIPTIPNIAVTGRNLDVEDVNDNLQALAASIQSNLDRRFTYCGSVFLPLAGATESANDLARRTLYIRRPGTSNAVEAFQLELTLYGNAAVTATVTCSDVSFIPLTLTTSATTTTECTAITNIQVPITSSSTDLTFTVAFSGAYTVSDGQMRLHLRSDRGNQGTSHAGYAPTLLNSASSTAGATLDAEFTAATTALGHDTTNQVDLRCMTFAVSNLAAAGTATFYLPAGTMTALYAQGYAVSASTTTGVTMLVADPAGIHSVSISVPYGGSANTIGTNGADISTLIPAAATAVMTTGSDCTITFTVVTNTAKVAYIHLWFT